MWIKLTILQKGLVLIAVPLVFQLAFFALLADMQRSNARAAIWAIHSKEVLAQTQVVLRNLLEMGTGMRGFILAADADLGAAYERAARQLPLDIAELKRRVSESPERAEQVQAIADTTEEFMAWHAETVRLSAAGQREQAIARAKSTNSSQVQEAIVQAVMTFIREEDRLDKERTATLERSRQRQQWLLVTGSIAAFLITLGLAFIFSRSIGGRLTTLAENAQRLVRGEQLHPPLEGKDEVAQLDLAVRGMAQEIAQSEQSLRKSAEEIRGLYEQARESELQVRRLNEELERRIEERTEELIRANRALLEADQRKDNFLAMLSHELRNPLAPIRNALQIMKMPGLSADAVDKTRAMMERQVKHLARLVDDLLDVSRSLRGKIELHKEYVDVATVFARAVEMAEPVLEAQGQELRVSLPERPIQVEGDLVRLAQVIHNLLVNAAKFTDRAGQIGLSAVPDEGEVAIRVRDTGIGIDPKLQPHIFDLFVQADNSLARSRGGLGIGLTLVRRLVELHGGSVSVTSQGVGHGSEFVVRLPAMTNALAEEARPLVGTQTTSGPPRRVLVVDDNVDAAESTAVLLRFLGHRVEVAHDGPSALSVVRDFQPEIVLLDIGLPGMSGYDVTKRLRANPENEGLVIAAVTGYGREEDIRRSREAGFDYHLTKPVATAALTAFVCSPPSSLRTLAESLQLDSSLVPRESDLK
jgi:signal transduction histidine kinase/ActR/RegA family two-component response regulator